MGNFNTVVKKKKSAFLKIDLVNAIPIKIPTDFFFLT